MTNQRQTLSYNILLAYFPHRLLENPIGRFIVIRLYTCLFILCLICICGTSQINAEDRLDIMAVSEGTTLSQDTLIQGENYEILLSFENDVLVGSIQVGFEIYSPSGASWSWLTQPDGYGPDGLGSGNGYLTVVSGSRMDPSDVIWDHTDIMMIEKDMDGVNPDTAFMGMLAYANGLPAGVSEPMLSLHLSPLTTGQGTAAGQICLDTAFVPPAGDFVFSNKATGLAIHPAFGGSICWVVVHSCPYDSDGDGFGDPGYAENSCPDDNCPAVANADQADSDGDGVGDVCDLCPGFDDMTDTDGDGVPDGCDVCPGFNDSIDADFDGVPDGCDICYGFDDNLDNDGDGVPDGCDLCPDFDDNIDNDSDGIPDGCDICPGFDDLADSDGDNHPDSCDNCPDDYNYYQYDSDGDGIGDECDYVCGDANGDRSVNIVDASFIVNMIFFGGALADPMEAADANCDGRPNIADASYLITWIFLGGDPPCCPDDPAGVNTTQNNRSNTDR